MDAKRMLQTLWGTDANLSQTNNTLETTSTVSEEGQGNDNDLDVVESAFDPINLPTGADVSEIEPLFQARAKNFASKAASNWRDAESGIPRVVAGRNR